jgi:two-component system phosphate regulon response regulator PhoB
MAKEKILVVDDEEDILQLVRYNLEREGYTTICVETGEQALQEAFSAIPDLVVLDLMLPGVDGLEVCKTLKNDPKTARIPIVMLTARSEDADIVTGLELGADDYMTKPFSPRVLLARVKAVLRRARTSTPEETDVVKVHDLVVDPTRRRVTVGDEEVELTATEFGILHFMAQRPGWVFTRSQIINSVKGPDYPVTERSVDVQVAGLRKKLGERGRYIKTVRGVGYRFEE